MYLKKIYIKHYTKYIQRYIHPETIEGKLLFCKKKTVSPKSCTFTPESLYLFTRELQTCYIKQIIKTRINLDLVSNAEKVERQNATLVENVHSFT